jgi:hypothetical protein
VPSRHWQEQDSHYDNCHPRTRILSLLSKEKIFYTLNSSAGLDVCQHQANAQIQRVKEKRWLRSIPW